MDTYNAHVLEGSQQRNTFTVQQRAVPAGLELRQALAYA